ncbi:Peptidase S8 S53 subtilisin kexin sedolisin protein [Rutstroemia sp. NJR-2017a BBW]|nr:Peptidase S8 S53 subtilisin kexin sedolisin protein [Rutstroemia sp. NJR-2017a BBW]
MWLRRVLTIISLIETQARVFLRTGRLRERGLSPNSPPIILHTLSRNRTLANYPNSCSSPAFAGIISLLNNARLSAGKRPLGFLNPWLYSVGKQGLNDIVHGGSKGCTYASWNATVGWDPVTGLGTPDFGKLLGLVKGY